MPLKSNLINIVCAVVLMLLPVSLWGDEVSDALRIKTVVIDPGHGGKDPGALSANKKYKEKDITLSVALKLGNLIKTKYPGIKVVYTRSTDKYVELSKRAEIANKNKADLFISIHVNSAKAAQARGTETFVMGTHKSDDNFQVCKTENSVIVIEDDYQTKYQGFNPNSPESYIIFSLLQNMHQEQSIKYAANVQSQFAKGPITVNRGVKQGGLLVLWKTTMPSVLTELGFISNPKDCSVLVSKNGQDQFARKLFNAFEAYKKEVEGSSSQKAGQHSSGTNAAPEAKPAVKPAENPAQKPVAKPVETPADKPVAEPSGKPSAAVVEKPAGNNDFYAVQILSVAKVLPKGAYDLRGCKDAKYIKVGNLYKYYVGNYSSRQKAVEALPAVRKQFPGAFVVHIKDNNIVK